MFAVLVIFKRLSEEKCLTEMFGGPSVSHLRCPFARVAASQDFGMRIVLGQGTSI